MKNYVYLIPAIFLLALGILSRTATKINTSTEANVDIACSTTSLTGEIDQLATVGLFEGTSFKIDEEFLAEDSTGTQVLGVASPSERYIEVDLSEQKLRAWDGSELYLETSISSGLPHTPTPVGEYRVWIKLRATKMEGGQGSYYYNLPNVPYVMFFENEKVPGYLGYGLHGTYWHNDFGTPRSHGCVNLPTPTAKKLYEWVGPTLPEGRNMVKSSADNPGTRVIIHE